MKPRDDHIQPNVTERCDLSIVVPAFDEQANIAVLYDALRNMLDETAFSWEIVYSDDGSSDSTWENVCELSNRDPRVRGVRLSRNFGHQYALLAGLERSRGQAVITMDADMQHPVEVIPKLIDAWQLGNRVVHAVRVDTEDAGALKKLSSSIFYKVYSFLSGVTIDPGMADFRLLDRQVIDDLLRFKEEGLFLRGLVQWVGYDSAKVRFVAHQRASGASKYSIRRMFEFAWTGITSFSIVPLRIGIYVGFLTSIVAFGGMGYAVWTKYYADIVVPGWASVLAIVSFLFGVLFIILGIIGDYIGRILNEVKRRPRYLISETTTVNGVAETKHERY